MNRSPAAVAAEPSPRLGTAAIKQGQSQSIPNGRKYPLSVPIRTFTPTGREQFVGNGMNILQDGIYARISQQYELLKDDDIISRNIELILDQLLQRSYT